MARIEEPTLDEEAQWQSWVAERPENVRAVAERFDPWSLYRIKGNGQRVTIVSFGEAKDGSVTLTVDVSADFNRILFERQVFGIDPNNLEPCELPDKNEPIGAFMTQEEVEANADTLRRMLRP